MSAQAIQAEAHDDPGPHSSGLHDADAQGYRQVLHDLIAMGTDLARLLHGQATTLAAQAVPHPAQQAHQAMEQPAPASEALVSLTLAFDRTARAVRRSILLARSLAAPILPTSNPAGHRAATRRRIIREVEDAIQRSANSANDGANDGHDAPETLQAELRDRLDAPDLDDDIGTRPTPDIISEICRDLGLAAPPGGAHPWKRRTPQDIAQLCAQAAAPSGARPPAAGPQGPKLSVAPPTSNPSPGHAARPHAQPGPIHREPTHARPTHASPIQAGPIQAGPIQAGPIQAGSNPPADPAGAVAMILRHPARVHRRCRPPPPP